MRALIAIGFGIGCCFATNAQERAPGLHLRFSNADDGEAATDDRRARNLALYLSAGEPASPFFDATRFHAEWRGSLRVEQRDRFAFTFRGVGHFVLEIDGNPVLQGRSTSPDGEVTSEPIRLRKGEHVIHAEFTNVPGQPAQVQLLWAGRKFAREPIPPSAFSHDPNPDALRVGELARHGRSLIAQRRCTACHQAELPAGRPPMPELAMAGSELEGIGRRLEAGWLAAWLRDPVALRPDARMPRMLHGDSATVARDAGDLAAFLATETRGEPWVAPENADAAIGGAVFADLGCIACHSISDETDAESGLVDLRGIGHKFRPGALAAFLRDPRRHDPWIRMPDLDLEPEEAANLAAFLRAKTVGAPFAAPSGDAERGRRRFGELGCAACHAGTVVRSSDASKPLREVLGSTLDRGCAANAADARGAAPDFGLTQREIAALRAFAQRGGESTFGLASAAEFASRMIEERRCDACHAIDGRTDAWTRRAELLNELGLSGDDEDPDAGHPAVAQHRPDLTWAGDKLRPDWLEELFAGRIQQPTRPWLHARMPSFPNLAEGLAMGLAAMHGHAPRMPELPEPEAGLAAIGRKLISLEAGFACVTCHGVADRPPVAVFEVQGTNLSVSGARLRPEYFARWMWDPPRLDASSRMPRYADDDGSTPFADVLDGDARRQFAAIWAYLRSIQ